MFNQKMEKKKKFYFRMKQGIPPSFSFPPSSPSPFTLHPTPMAIFHVVFGSPPKNNNAKIPSVVKKERDGRRNLR